MRILIITTFFPPLNSIASLRPHSWAKYWTIAGHDVTVLTIKRERDDPVALELPNPGYELLEIEPPPLFNRLKKARGAVSEASPGFLQKIVHYLRYKRGILNACRMPDLTDLWVKPAKKALEGRGDWDLVVSTYGPYAPHRLAYQLKKQGRAKTWIADYRDTWSDNHIYPGLFPFNLIEKVLERRFMRQADRITTVSIPFATRFSTKYGNEKVYAVENGFDPIDLSELDTTPIFPDDGKYRIVLTGSVYPHKQDPSPLFEAIRQIEEDVFLRYLLEFLEVIFVGPEHQCIEEMAEKYGVSDWVKVLGFVPREQALRMQRDAHALLFLPWKDMAVDGVLTGKIFEYLYSQTPIIAVGGQGMEASQRLILEAKAGKVFNDVEEIKHYLVDHLVTVKKEKNDINPKFLNRYNRRVLAEKMLLLGKKP